MFLLESYAAAVVFCFITMMCWGSWANTQKLAGKTWPFEMFYWDYVFGVLAIGLIFAFTMGSIGDAGRGFIADLQQAQWENIGLALLSGVVFNAGNICLVAAIAVAGMAVAFPVGIGLALVLGVVLTYLVEPSGNPWIIFTGVGLIAFAIIIDAIAYGKLPGQGKDKGSVARGLVLAVLCGVLMAGFGPLFAMVKTMPNDMGAMEAGKLSPYTAMIMLGLGILAAHILFNFSKMVDWCTSAQTAVPKYFTGRFGDHLWGIVGGMIWGVGTMFFFIASDKAGTAIAYALGQGATMVAALWGVFVWREFKNAPRGTNPLLFLMFIGFIAGLAMLIWAGLDPSERDQICNFFTGFLP